MRAAWELFDRFPGRWEVLEIAENPAAREFWRKTIEEYTRGNYREYFLDNEEWHGPVQVFEAGRLTTDSAASMPKRIERIRDVGRVEDWRI